MLGDVAEKNAALADLSFRELAVFAPFVLLVFWIGLYPTPFFRMLERPSAQIVERVQPGYHAARGLANPLAASARPLVADADADADAAR
jgi:NADH-quinone oxidoreductase subunit M